MNDIHIADRKATKTMASYFDVNTPSLTLSGQMRFGRYLTTRVKRGPGKGRKRPKTIVYIWEEL